jgi:hypothetical protein
VKQKLNIFVHISSIYLFLVIGNFNTPDFEWDAGCLWLTLIFPQLQGDVVFISWPDSAHWLCSWQQTERPILY